MWRKWLVCAVLLLFSIIEDPPSAKAHDHNDAVLDTDGKELESGLDYYIKSALWVGGGGGLSLSSRNGSFPFNVVQHHNDMNRGRRITFHLLDGKKINSRSLSLSWAASDRETLDQQGEVIRESTDLKIQFADIPAFWQLSEADESGGTYVSIGGADPRQKGQFTVNNSFRIETFGPYGYKIVHCPSVCDSCKTVCGNLGTTIRDGKRWLALSKDPLWVMFEPADPVLGR